MAAKMKRAAIHFGTDGWRGVIGGEFTFENVRTVAAAVAKTFRAEVPVHKKIFVGYDHRFLAEKFAQESGEVLAHYGFEPCLLPQPVTSPFLSFLTWHARAPFGIMITASHNPPEYLGLKVKGGFGGSILPEMVARIEKNMRAGARFSWPKGSDLHEAAATTEQRAAKQFRPYLSSYLHYLRSHVDCSLFSAAKISVLFDGLYGPGGKIAQRFFHSFKNRVTFDLMHGQRDPLFGGIHPEPIEENLAELKSRARQGKFRAIFAVDGDGDRLGVLDEAGRYLTPQQVFSLLLHYLLKEKGLRGKVVQTLSLGYVSERIAGDYGCPFEEVPVGFKYVAEKMLAEDVILGGEESGGYAFGRTRSGSKKRSVLPERDGLLSAFLFLEMLLRTGQSVSELLRILRSRYGASYFLRKDMSLSGPIENKANFVRRLQNSFPSRWRGRKVREVRTFDGLKIVLSDGSWILARPSGTEPLLRIYAEFPDRVSAEQSLEKMAALAAGMNRS